MNYTKNHAGGKQRGIRKRLAARRPKDRGEDRATRTWVKGAQAVEDERWRARRIELGRGDPKVLKEDTPQFDPANKESSPNARRARWDELLKENRGKIDRRACGKNAGRPRRHRPAQGRSQRAHAVRARGWIAARRAKSGIGNPTIPAEQCREKATDATMAKEMRMMARMGHPCGGDFLAKPFLAAHPSMPGRSLICAI